MLSRLERLATEIGALHSKLLLLVGAPRSDKSAVLKAFGERMGALPVNVGLELGQRLTSIPYKRRHLEAGDLLRELAEQHTQGDLLLIDNIELLFDKTLQLDPLDLLKRHAQARNVVAVWPGELHNDRLTYADMGHPEHQNYALDGVVIFDTQQ
jgi:hypothetical protein